MDGTKDVNAKETAAEKQFICENLGAIVEVPDDSTAEEEMGVYQLRYLYDEQDRAHEEEIDLYQWRCLREEQDRAYEEALVADQAKVIDFVKIWRFYV